jgi:hypothetical protein
VNFTFIKLKKIIIGARTNLNQKLEKEKRMGGGKAA